jgi:hypothetical protein
MKNFKSVLFDPQRRKQIIWRCVESLAGLILVAIFGWMVIPLGILLDFLLYEYVLEPKKLAGPYWERTPVEGTTFTHW